MPKYKQRTGFFSNSTPKGSTSGLPGRPFHRGFAPRFHARIFSDHSFGQYQSDRSWEALEENNFRPIRPCFRMRWKPRSIPMAGSITKAVSFRSQKLPRHTQSEFTPRFHARIFKDHSFDHNQSDRSWKALQENNFRPRPCFQMRCKPRSIPLTDPKTRVKT